METVERGHPGPSRIAWLGLVLAWAAALAYVWIGSGFLAVGDLTAAERPPGIIVVTAASYLVGGLLILAGRRWLWIAGAIVNALVILAFVGLYLERPAVLLSPGGLATKGAQLLLEVGLLALIATDWHRTRRPSATRGREMAPVAG